MKQGQGEALAGIELGHRRVQPGLAVGADGGGLGIRAGVGDFGGGLQRLHRPQRTPAIKAEIDEDAAEPGIGTAARRIEARSVCPQPGEGLLAHVFSGGPVQQRAQRQRQRRPFEQADQLGEGGTVTLRHAQHQRRHQRGGGWSGAGCGRIHLHHARLRWPVGISPAAACQARQLAQSTSA